MRRLLAHLLLLTIAIVILGGKAVADTFIVGRFTLARSATSGEWSLAARLPASFTPTADPVLPQACRETGRGSQILDRSLVVTFDFVCDTAPGDGDTIQIPWPIDAAQLEIAIGAQKTGTTTTTTATTLPNGRAGIELPMTVVEPDAAPSLAVAAKFVTQGVTHILEGWDHLCFLFCLCMLVRGKRLVILVTAFTIGHSISLSLAFLGYVSLPGPPVEALIALSIALLAREAIIRDPSLLAYFRDGVVRAEPRAQQDRWWHYAFTVAGFGLIHGLGFASTLSELGVSPVVRVLGLASFNLGVELGQLLFVGVIALLLTLLRSAEIDRPLRFAGLIAAGVIGWYWMVERLIGFTPYA
jgi:hypothetical protein